MNNRTKHMKKHIPYGRYCYDKNGHCPYYNIVERGEHALYEKVRCNYLSQDFSFEKHGLEAIFFLDMCKICDVHNQDEDDHYFKWRRQHWLKKIRQKDWKSFEEDYIEHQY